MIPVMISVNISTINVHFTQPQTPEVGRKKTMWALCCFSSTSAFIWCQEASLGFCLRGSRMRQSFKVISDRSAVKHGPAAAVPAAERQRMEGSVSGVYNEFTVWDQVIVYHCLSGSRMAYDLTGVEMGLV
jgi:hypothetical protein